LLGCQRRMEQKTEATGGTVTPRAHDPDHSRLDLGCRRPGRQAGARALPVSDGQAGVLRFGESLRAVLKARPNIRIEIDNEYLDSARFPDERHPRRLADDRIAQEALRNVNKHSSARHARVELYGSPGAVHLGVADDGAGFDPGSAIARRGSAWSACGRGFAPVPDGGIIGVLMHRRSGGYHMATACLAGGRPLAGPRGVRATDRGRLRRGPGPGTFAEGVSSRPKQPGSSQ